MGVKESLEDFYYKITDWLDDKGIPHFVLYLIALLVVLGIVFLLLPLFSGELYPVKVSVMTESKEFVSGQPVEITIGESTQTLRTLANGSLKEFSVKPNEKIKISISREGFDDFSEEYVIDRKNYPVTAILKKPELPALTRVNLMINKPSGELLEGIEATISLSCSNTAVVPSPSIVTTSTGQASINVPENCGTLKADVSARNFEPKQGILLRNAEMQISLTAIEVAKGKAIVKIFDSDGSLLKERFTVALFDSEGLEAGSSETIEGSVEFSNVEAVEYYATVTDFSGRFETIRTESKTLAKNGSITFIARPKRQTKGQVQFKVLNAVDNSRIANANVKILLKASGGSESIAAKFSTDSNSDKNVALYDYGNYIVQIEHSDFLAFEQDLNFTSASSVFTARLEKCSESARNCGKLEVTVLDEDNLTVENALVSLYNAETQFLAASSQTPVASDANGIAKFSNLKAGKYFLRAFKYPAEKKDSANVFSIEPKVPAKQTIRMEIGTGILKVIVKDNEGTALANAKVEFRTESGKECPKPDGSACEIETSAETGSAEFAFKADKKVYAIVSKEDYSSLVSNYYPILKGQTITLNAVLKRTIPGTIPEFNLVGIFAMDGTTRKNELKAGERYVLRLKLDIPELLEPKTAGFFIMAGSKEKGSILENDALYLRSVLVPEISAIKGTSWNPDNGMELDTGLDSLTNAEFKWVNASINNPKSNTTYLVDAEIKVKENITPGSPLMFYYRAWAENESTGEIIRTPEDQRLGTALESSSIQYLYALAKEQPFYEGKPALCDDESGFCFYNDRIFDFTERLNLTEPFKLKVSQTYTLSFEISNISQTVYGIENNARFQFKNTEDLEKTSNVLQILDYNFLNSDASQVSQQGFNDFEIPEIQIRDLEPNKSFRMQLNFTPKERGSSSFFARIIANNEVVFSKEITVSINAENQLSVNAIPDFFGAFAAADFNAIVTDSKGIEVEEAVVKVSKITPDKAEALIASEKTNRLGTAIFRIPSSSPGTIIRIEAGKENYSSAVKEILIDENIISFDPEELSVFLNLKNRTSKEVSTIAENKVPLKLSLSNARVSGRFGGFLDEDLMNNYITQFIGNYEIQANDSRTFTVMSAVSPSAIIEKEKKVQGQVHLEFHNADLDKTWAFNIPYSATVNIGSSVDETGCLNISLKEWQAMTQENLATKEFTILNNCQVEGSDIPVDNLKARLKWESNPIGNVQVNVFDPNTGSSAAEILKDGEWVTLFEALRPSEEAQYYSTVSFSPSKGHLNEEAKFSIEFDASTQTDSGAKSVGASNAIKAQILVTTLAECLEFEPGNDTGVRIKAGEDEKTFTISTEKCGENTKVQLRFCQDSAENTNCRGGTTEGGIEVTPWTTSNLSNATKEISVRRQGIPGYYGLTVEAKVPGRSWQKITDYPIVIEPKENKAFWLDKYNFVMLGAGAKDSTAVYNRLYEETVTVKADYCAWGEAVDNLGPAAQTGVLSGVGAGLVLVLAGVAALAATGVGIVVAIIVFAVMYFTAQDCSDKFMENDLQDFIINLSGTMNSRSGHYLPPDAQEVILGNQDFKAEWNFDVRDVADKAQNVGLVLENLGIATDKPIYDILEISSTEHVHGDWSHAGKAKVQCETGKFSYYWIGPSANQGSCEGAEDTSRTESFHIMVKTQETRQMLPKINFDTMDCSTTSLLGRTGEGALPKIKLDWSWQDSSGIDFDSCDADNPNGFYCDATQFSIAFSKRMKLLDDFFKANNYFENICPENTSGSSEQALLAWDGKPIESRTILPNTAFIKSIIKQDSEYNAANHSNDSIISITVENDSQQAASLAMNSELYLMSEFMKPNGATIANSCNGQQLTVQAGREETVTCSLSLEPKGYLLKASLSPQASIDSNAVLLSFFVLEKTSEQNDFQQSTGCWLPRTTEFAFGESTITRFIDAAGGFNSGVNPTPQIFDKQSLLKIISFDAFLMRDGFPMDFRNDFVNYYTRESLADAPQFFKNDAQGFKKYFLDNEKLKFSNKYFESDSLGSAGRFKVNIKAQYFEDWKLYNGNNEPKASIAVSFYLIQEPSPNSPFYSAPLNGNVGLEGDSLNRQGYGVRFLNQNDPIIIDNSLISSKTAPDAGSNALTVVKTRVEENLKNLNSDLTKKGNLLSIETTSNTEKQLEFSPNLATPLMLEVSAPEKTSTPFSAFYSFLQNGSPVVVGDSLSLWSAGGNCYDFSGLPLIQAFDEKPDRKATALDNIANWETSYGLDWPSIEMPGDNYLRTIFYTPKSTHTSLQAMHPESALGFFTPDNEGTSVSLDGISTMQNNNINSSVSTISEVFDLVREGKVCVTSTGVRTRFWWNPQIIYNQAGMKRSISGMSKNLEAGTNCIG